MTKTLRAKALETLQLLRRIEEADDNGYCDCVTCGAPFFFKKGDGGHFIPKGDSSFWALEEVNVNPQCKGCNGFGMRYGTATQEYTLWMERKYGTEFVQNMLDTKRDIRKYYAADYREMTTAWKERIKHHKKRIGV